MVSKLKYTEDTLLPFGRWKGYKLKDTPASYLLVLHSKQRSWDKDLWKYLDANYERIKARAIEEEKNTQG